jgi:hypothetical protein
MEMQRNELRQRLRELLTVPERERTDAQWDEIIELEIRLAPGNQIDPNRSNNEPLGGGQNFRQPRQNKGGGGHPGQQRKQGQGQGRRPNKGNPQRSGGGGGGGNSGGGTPPQSSPV